MADRIIAERIIGERIIGGLRPLSGCGNATARGTSLVHRAPSLSDVQQPPPLDLLQVQDSRRVDGHPLAVSSLEEDPSAVAVVGQFALDEG